MILSDARNALRIPRWKSSTLFLSVAALLLLGTPVWADFAQPAGNSDTVKSSGDTATPASVTEPPVPDAAAIAPPAPEKAKPATELGAGATTGIDAYTGGSLPSTGIGALGGSSAAGDDTKPIIVSRSGGLPSLIFTNKAENWVSAKFSLGQSYDNNVSLTSNKREDFITTVSPSIAFNYQNQLLDWSLGSTLDYRYYLRNYRTQDFSYGLNTGGRIKIYRDVAYINVTDIYTQTSQSNAVDSTLVSSSVNVTDLNTLRLNPCLEIPISSRIRFNPQYAYTDYWYPTQSQQNRQNHAASADFSYELSPRLTPYLGYNFTRTEGQYLQYNQNYPYIGIRYGDDRFVFKGSAGYSRINTDAGATSDGIVWNASLSYQLATTSFTLATSSDVDQATFLNASYRKMPQIVTSYSGSVSRELRKATVSLSLYFRENTDAQTLDLMSRRFGSSVSLNHVLSPRLSGNFTCRVERSDQRTIQDEVDLNILLHTGSIVFVPVDTGGTQALLYQLGYTLTFKPGHDWTFTGNYSYADSASPNTTSYSDNKLVFSAGKSF